MNGNYTASINLSKTYPQITAGMKQKTHLRKVYRSKRIKIFTQLKLYVERYKQKTGNPCTIKKSTYSGQTVEESEHVQILFNAIFMTRIHKIVIKCNNLSPDRIIIAAIQLKLTP